MRYALDERETVRLNGWNHALCYRAAAENLPLMLFLHGGPGAPDRHLVLDCQSALAEYYTLVCWDQRGAGLSYDPARVGKEEMTLPQVLEDARQVKEYLLRKFKQEALILVAHSWGTALGTLLCSAYPEGIAAYLGSGQIVNTAEGERLSYELFAVKRRCAGMRRRCANSSASARRKMGAISRPRAFGFSVSM